MTDGRSEQQAAVERRRRMAAIFGDPLPERTRDELSDGRAEDAGGGAGDEDWLRNEVPPHHG